MKIWKVLLTTAKSRTDTDKPAESHVRWQYIHHHHHHHHHLHHHRFHLVASFSSLSLSFLPNPRSELNHPHSLGTLSTDYWSIQLANNRTPRESASRERRSAVITTHASTVDASIIELNEHTNTHTYETSDNRTKEGATERDWELAGRLRASHTILK